MEQSKDLERMIKETVSIAIAASMKIHTESMEKKLSENLEAFTARLDTISAKIESIEKAQLFSMNKVNAVEGYVNEIWKENAAIKKEHEEVLKKIKESQRKVEIVQMKTNELKQYGRKAMLEINGFPRSAQEDPWKITLDLAKKLDVALAEDNIEACHRISTNDKAGFIVKVSSRKKRDELLNAGKTLASISIADFGFKGEGKIFINESLTAKRKALIWELKSKKEEYHFKYVWSKKGTMFIRRDEYSRAIRINGISDLNKLNE